MKGRKKGKPPERFDYLTPSHQVKRWGYKERPPPPEDPYFAEFLAKKGVNREFFRKAYRYPRLNFDAEIRGMRKYDHAPLTRDVSQCNIDPNREADSRFKVHSERTFKPDWEILRRAMDFTVSQYYPFTAGWTPLSDEEAVIRLPSDTSPGYPFILTHQTKGDMKEDGTLLEALRAYESRILENPHTLIALGLKSELRDGVKVDLNSIRVFAVCGAEVSAFGSKYCSPGNTRFHRAAERTWSTVGTPIFYGHWDRRIKRMSGKLLSEVDAHNWDGSLAYELMMFVAKYRGYTLSTNISREEREIIIAKLFCFYHNLACGFFVLSNGDVYEVYCGNDSGQPATTEDNTIINTVALNYSMLRKLQDSMRYEEMAYKFVREHCEAWLCGDDNVFWSDVITASDHAKYAGEIGIEITMRTSEARPAHEVTYNSLTSVWCKETAQWLPMSSDVKIISSMLGGGGTYEPSVEYTCQRLSALQIMAYPGLFNEKPVEYQAFALLEEFRTYMFDNYGAGRYSAYFHDERAMRQLWTGREGPVGLAEGVQTELSSQLAEIGCGLNNGFSEDRYQEGGKEGESCGEDGDEGGVVEGWYQP